MLARRIGLPFVVALVIGGLLVEETHLTTLPTLDPSLVLLGPILVLAVPGTLLTVLIVGVIVFFVLHLPLALGLVFGSIVAATDPVAVVGVFRGLNAPARLEALVESKSLINDGVAITVYATILGFALTGTANAAEVATVFGREVLGGVLVGSLLGFVFSRLTGAVDDHRIEMMLSVSLAYGSYVAAQWLHASGPLACVAAGLIHGSYGRRIGMSETTRRLLDDLWEFFGFVTNALVFLLVGFIASLASLVAQASGRQSWR
jgi:monovalent cation:H+ antiporter, CPA1 family